MNLANLIKHFELELQAYGGFRTKSERIARASIKHLRELQKLRTKAERDKKLIAAHNKRMRKTLSNS